MLRSPATGSWRRLPKSPPVPPKPSELERPQRGCGSFMASAPASGVDRVESAVSAAAVSVAAGSEATASAEVRKRSGTANKATRSLMRATLASSGGGASNAHRSSADSEPLGHRLAAAGEMEVEAAFRAPADVEPHHLGAGHQQPQPRTQSAARAAQRELRRVVPGDAAVGEERQVESEP